MLLIAAPVPIGYKYPHNYVTKDKGIVIIDANIFETYDNIRGAYLCKRLVLFPDGMDFQQDEYVGCWSLCQDEPSGWLVYNSQYLCVEEVLLRWDFNEIVYELNKILNGEE